MKIVIEIIPHQSQRYETVGDYWIDQDGVIQVRVSAMAKPVYEEAVILHELTELFLVLNRGILIEDIDAFDIAFEAERSNDIDEPGDDPAAPYQNEHCFATAVERMFIAAIGEKWAGHDRACRNA